MSPLLAASIGSYPRTGEDKDQQRYPRALGHFERKEISAHALRDVEQSVVQEIIREQLDAGVDEVTDGLITWPDPITRFTRHLTNVPSGGLRRYFDNNFFYRVPTITGKPRIGASVSAAECKFARSVSNKPVRAVLTGPVTLALHTASSVKPYDKLPVRIELFADVVGQEIGALAAEGAAVIQIDEPALVDQPQHLPALQKVAAAWTAKKGASRLALALYFGDPTPLVPSLADLPMDVWHLDAIGHLSGLLAALSKAPKNVSLGLGILDARTTRLETTEDVTKTLAPWWAARGEGTHYLAPSCGLEFLPRASAAAKLRRLSEIRLALSGAASGGGRA